MLCVGWSGDLVGGEGGRGKDRRRDERHDAATCFDSDLGPCSCSQTQMRLSGADQLVLSIPSSRNTHLNAAAAVAVITTLPSARLQ